jgi:hypothetical protein
VIPLFELIFGRINSINVALFVERVAAGFHLPDFTSMEGIKWRVIWFQCFDAQTYEPIYSFQQQESEDCDSYSD